MSYNVDNLFDDIDDGTEYSEYDPSQSSWNTDFFHKRCASIAEVIRSVSLRGPDIIALQEVENKNTLHVLNSVYLKRLNYRYSVIVACDGSATNVAFLSRHPIARVHSHHIGDWNGLPLRSILEVEIKYRNTSIHIFNNHWKSKSGGAYETESLRIDAAGIVCERIRSIHNLNPDADIIVLGDLNENIEEYHEVRALYQTALIPHDVQVPDNYAKSSLFVTGLADDTEVDRLRVILYDAWYELPEDQRGSYVYRGDWETLDHVLLSAGLFDENGFYYQRGSFRVMRNYFLLSETGLPLKWTVSGRSHGFSDHLPLLIRLRFSPP